MPMPTKDELERLPPDGGSDYNRLIFEKSPYLLQHALNPVDWHPWGDEAFETALREDKPVFLSVGYSTCHWCHVMERESFDDAAVARLLNDAFVCVKVDREERPDIDNVYMSVCRAVTGGGGWPLTIIMTPDKRPFFAATYIPKNSMYGRSGMLELIPRVLSFWTERRAEVLESAERITSVLIESVAGGPGRDMEEDVLRQAHEGLAERYDAVHGGFGGAPKFPTPHNLLFLLRYWRRTGEKRALEMVEHTLARMRGGGIFDHLGFGFHRYSTDGEWLVPHFEKMLYDQAMLAMAYVEAHQATGAGEFACTAREIFQYVLSDMTSPEGAFYSAEDADSQGEEGRYYLWTLDEIVDVLGEDDGGLFGRAFNMTEDGNFQEEAGGPPGARNILHLKRPLSDLAGEAGMSERDLEDRLETARRKLLKTRRRKVPPYKDDKVLTNWNGLMIAALAKGAQALGEPGYADAAASAADFALDHMVDGGGRLLHRYREGAAGIPAFLDDYAFLAWGLLELYEASFDCRYLQSAIDLTNQMIEGFWDEEGGGFFFYGGESEVLIVRGKDVYDGAVPSGNSVAAVILSRLGRAAASVDFESKAERTIRAFSAEISRAPHSHTQMMTAVDFTLGPSYEVVIVGSPDGLWDDAMVVALRTAFVPNKVVLFRPANDKTPPITRIAEFTERQPALNGKTTAYVCINHACKEPTVDPSRMLKLLGVQ